MRTLHHDSHIPSRTKRTEFGETSLLSSQFDTLQCSAKDVFVRVSVLKLLKMAKGIRALLDTVIQALPQVGNLVNLFLSIPMSSQMKDMLLASFLGSTLLPTLLHLCRAGRRVIRKVGM